jgi:hypothetical protein
MSNKTRMKRPKWRSKKEKRNTKPKDFIVKIFEEEPNNLSLKYVQKICIVAQHWKYKG